MSGGKTMRIFAEDVSYRRLKPLPFRFRITNDGRIATGPDNLTKLAIHFDFENGIIEYHSEKNVKVTKVENGKVRL